MEKETYKQLDRIELKLDIIIGYMGKSVEIETIRSQDLKLDIEPPTAPIDESKLDSFRLQAEKMIQSLRR